MKKPECGCFNADEERGQDMIELVASKLVVDLPGLMNASGLCQKTTEYAMVTCCALIVRAFAEMTTPWGETDMEGYRVAVDAKSRELVKVLLANVVERDGELGQRLQVLMAQDEREHSSGRLQ